MEKEMIVQLETTLDHLTGEELGLALCDLNDSPYVLDAVYVPVTGKKNRPAGILQVLCRRENESLAVEAVFRHTHTLGIRRIELERYVLPRHIEKTCIAGETVRAKVYALDNVEYIRPEADEIKNMAHRHKKGAPAFRFAIKNQDIFQTGTQINHK